MPFLFPFCPTACKRSLGRIQDPDLQCARHGPTPIGGEPPCRADHSVTWEHCLGFLSSCSVLWLSRRPADAILGWFGVTMGHWKEGREATGFARRKMPICTWPFSPLPARSLFVKSPGPLSKQSVKLQRCICGQPLTSRNFMRLTQFFSALQLQTMKPGSCCVRVDWFAVRMSTPAPHCGSINGLSVVGGKAMKCSCVNHIAARTPLGLDEARQ